MSNMRNLLPRTIVMTAIKATSQTLVDEQIDELNMKDLQQIRTMLLVIVLCLVISTSLSIPLPNTELHIEKKGLSILLPNKQIQPTYPDFKQYGRQRAVLEREHWLSQKDSAYNKLQLKAARYLTVKPFVDKIPENAREGNIGMLQRNVAKSLMANIESISIAINKLVDLPFQTKDHIQRTADAALNAVGSKFVGI